MVDIEELLEQRGISYDQYGGYFDETEQIFNELVDTISDTEAEFDYYSNKIKNDVRVENREVIQLIKGFHLLTMSQTESFLRTANEKGLINDANSPHVHTVFNMHTRAVRTYLEVITLIIHGLPDGAYARNRTLYEIVFNMRVFNQYGGRAVQSFNKHELKKGNKFDWILGIPEVKKQFPEYYGKNKKKFNLHDINKICSDDGYLMERWKKVYGISNKIIHITHEGTFSSLSTDGEYLANPDYSTKNILIVADHVVKLFSMINTLFYQIILDELNPTEEDIELLQYTYFNSLYSDRCCDVIELRLSQDLTKKNNMI
ncbi:DUF5677 domain-containing protein [Erysipelothrix rhusiopathiae]|nr:DUF5677 domain-containing protein [Erysipelothrix rhusiopathiae]